MAKEKRRIGRKVGGGAWDCKRRGFVRALVRWFRNEGLESAMVWLYCVFCVKSEGFGGFSLINPKLLPINELGLLQISWAEVSSISIQ